MNNWKSVIKKTKDIEILSFFYLNVKIKMIKLNSNSVIVDEKSKAKKANKVLLRRWFFFLIKLRLYLKF